MGAMFKNLWTTILGIGGGMFYYLANSGAKIPSNKQETFTLLIAAFFAAFGIVAKDATTGSKPQ